MADVNESVSDSLVWANEITPLVFTPFTSSIAFASSITALRDLQEHLVSIVRLADASALFTYVEITDSISFSEEAIPGIIAIIKDLISFNSSVLTEYVVHAIATLAWLDAVDKGIFLSVEDTLDFQSVIKSEYYLALVDVLNFTSTSTAVKDIILSLVDTLNLDMSIEAVRSLYASIEDSLVFGGALVLPEITYDVLVVNTSNLGSTRYTQYPFESFAGNFATQSDGIYELEGSDDEGEDIPWEFELGISNFGGKLGDAEKYASTLKYNPVAYVGMTSTGKTVLKVVTSNANGRTEDWFEAESVNAGEDMQRYYLGKRRKSVFYGYKLKSIKATDVEILSFVAVLVLLPRKI